MPRSSTSSRGHTHVPIRVQSPLGPTMGPFTPTTPTFTQTMKDGLAFGAGAAVARNLVDRMMSPQTTVPVQTKSCETQLTAFNQCIKAQLPENTCQDSLELLNQCLKQQK